MRICQPLSMEYSEIDLYCFEVETYVLPIENNL